jgi:hypothetical protein
MLHDDAMMLAGAGLVRRPRNSSTSSTRAAPQVVPSSSVLRCADIVISSNNPA